MVLAAGARDGLGFERHHLEVVGETAAGDFGIEARGELGVLCGDVGRVAGLVPVVSGAGCGAEPEIFLFLARTVAAVGDECCRADGDRIRTLRASFRDIRARADAA